MGHKVSPIGFRLLINRNWSSQWYASKGQYKSLLLNDLKIRGYLNKMAYPYAISEVIIRRKVNKVSIEIISGRVGAILGRGGSEIEKIRRAITNIAGCEVDIKATEERRPETNAPIISRNIAKQLEKRVAFKRAIKMAISSAMRSGCKGIKIRCAGRLGGAEIARSEWYKEGRIPLHTLKSRIDYSLAEAHTTYGVIGVKTWVFHGESSSRVIYVGDQ